MQNDTVTTSSKIPTRFEPLNQWEAHISWNDGKSFGVPYAEIRFHCPCAGCVDEHTGQRTITRESVAADIKPTKATVVGRYALQITWSDHHQTGMYHFDRLYELCEKLGKKIQ